MDEPHVSRLPGVCFTKERGIHFSIENLSDDEGQSSEEIKLRNRTVKDFFGFPSYHRMLIEFRASVGPYYSHLSHSEHMDVVTFVAKLTEHWPKPDKEPPSWDSRHKLSPLDIFSLPFRHLVLSETLEVMGKHYGIRYVHTFMFS